MVRLVAIVGVFVGVLLLVWAWSEPGDSPDSGARAATLSAPQAVDKRGEFPIGRASAWRKQLTAVTRVEVVTPSGVSVQSFETLGPLSDVQRAVVVRSLDSTLRQVEKELMEFSADPPATQDFDRLQAEASNLLEAERCRVCKLLLEQGEYLTAPISLSLSRFPTDVDPVVIAPIGEIDGQPAKVIFFLDRESDLGGAYREAYDYAVSLADLRLDSIVMEFNSMSETERRARITSAEEAATRLSELGSGSPLRDGETRNRLEAMLFDPGVIVDPATATMRLK